MRKRIIITCAAVLICVLFLSSHALAEARYTNGGYAASPSEKLLDRVISLSVAKDHVALQKLLDSGLVIILKKGIKVEIVKTKIFSGTVKIRPYETNLELWTVIEAVTKK